MKVMTKQLRLKTKGTGDLINITDDVQHMLDQAGLEEGNVTIFVIGSTAAIITFEYEPGLIADIRKLFETIASASGQYLHDQTWADANGFSHIRAALQGPSLVVPFSARKLMVGTWQQVVLAEFDTKPRQRTVVVQFIGE